MKSDNVPARLADQFDDLEQQLDVAVLGMWTFLATEVLFFGGLFFAYIVYRLTYPGAFIKGSHELSVAFGTVNTAILLTSSLTMVLAVQASGENKRRAATWFLLLTAALGAAFLVVKGFEYHEDFVKHLVPGEAFIFPQREARPVQIFFMLYYMMTAIHALHLTIGIILISIMAYRENRGDFGSAYTDPIEVSGLYWHFIDLVWIFLYPLLYLVDRYSG